MSKLMLEVPAELKAIVERYPTMRWERIAEEALWDYARKVQLADRIAVRSRLNESSAAAVGRKAKSALSRRYAKAAR